MTAPHDESLPTDKQLRLKRVALSPNKEASEQTGGDDGELRPILGGESSAEEGESSKKASEQTGSDDRELRPILGGESSAEEGESRKSISKQLSWGMLRNVLIACELWLVQVLVSSAYSIIGPFFPTEVCKV